MTEEKHISLKSAWIIVLVTFILDQASKLFMLYGLNLQEVGSISILPFLNFTMVWNKGISMGLPPGDWLGFYGIIGITFLVLVYLARWMHKESRYYERLSLTFIMGGAIGNLLDRFLHGAVVDFIHFFGFGHDFYVFNVADSAITIGAIILVLDSLHQMLKRPKNDEIKSEDRS